MTRTSILDFPLHTGDEDEERAFPLTLKELNSYRWVVAIEAADQWGDLSQLAKCFRRGVPLSKDVREMLADLFTGRRLSHNYPFSEQQQRLLTAYFEYKTFLRSGEVNKQRLERVARENKVDEEKLRELIEGKGHFANRLRQMRKDKERTR